MERDEYLRRYPAGSGGGYKRRRRRHREDFDECRAYWMREYTVLSEKTRSIITLSFSMLVRPFITRPLRKLFSTDIKVAPEDTFKEKVILVNLAIQEFRLAGRVANLSSLHSAVGGGSTF